MIVDSGTLGSAGLKIRNRDTLEQVRVADDQVSAFVSEFVRGA